jgi:Domain of unknown function (DUF4136)
MSAFLEEAMKISWQFLLAGIMCLVSLTAAAQDAEAKRDVKVNWVRGTDFSKYRTYAWGTSHQKTPNPAWNQHLIEDIDVALQAKGLHKVEMDGKPDLIVAYDAGTQPAYSIAGLTDVTEVKEGTLVVGLVDSQFKKAVWSGIANDIITDKPEKDLPMVQKRISKMFKQYPPPANK